MDRTEQLRVAEHFHSLQGEGSTSGKPSIFLRLSMCNLMCGGIGTEKDKQLHNGATWRCDTIEVWRQGENKTVKQVAELLVQEYGKYLIKGSQLVITGGEPLLQQKQIQSLLKHLQEYSTVPRIEIETNGTIPPDTEIIDLVDQFNVSPKLLNSGMPESKRINPQALNTLVEQAKCGKAIFKFVVTSVDDPYEIVTDYVEPYGIPEDKIWIMPGCSNREQYEKVAPIAAFVAQEYGFNFSSRLQINLWNEVTGV